MTQITPASPEPLVDVATVARFLGVPSSWVYERSKHYGMPHHFVGRYLRFRLSEVQDWMDGQAPWKGGK